MAHQSNEQRDAAMHEMRQASAGLSGHRRRAQQLDEEIRTLERQDADLADREHRLSTYSGTGDVDRQFAELRAGRSQIDAAVRERRQLRDTHLAEAATASGRQHQAAQELHIQAELTRAAGER